MISLARFNSRETIQESNLSREYASTFEQKYINLLTGTGKISHGPPSPTWYITIRDFSTWGQHQSCLPKPPLVTGHLCQQSLLTACLFLLKPSWGWFTLLLWFSPSRGLSGSFHLFFLMICAETLATVPSLCLLTRIWHQIWIQGPGTQRSIKFFTVSLGLRACCLSSTQEA